MDDRDLQGARGRVPEPQPVQQRASRSMTDILKKWPMDPTAPDVAELDRGDVRPAERDRRTRVRPSTTRTPRRRSRRGRCSRTTSAIRRGPTRTRTTPRRSRTPSASCVAASSRPRRRTPTTARRSSSARARRAMPKRADRAPHPRRRRVQARGARLGGVPASRTRTRRTRTRAGTGSRTRSTTRCASRCCSTSCSGGLPRAAPQEIEQAKAAAIDVRDSNEDDKYLDNAGIFVVDEADIDRDLEYQRCDDTKGRSGIEHRTAVKFDGPDPETRKVLEDPIPQPILASIAAREEYVQRVPASARRDHNAPRVPVVRRRRCSSSTATSTRRRLASSRCTRTTAARTSTATGPGTSSSR